jgi:acyl carrier protein
MNDELIKRIREIAADIFGEATDDVTAATTPSDLESWDSLAQLNLIAAVEDEFSLEISPEEMETLMSIEAIAALVDSRR